MNVYRLRWGDLISPRAVFEFTLGDAVAAIPSLLVIFSILAGGILLLWGIKKIVEMITLRHQQPGKYVLVTCTTCPDGEEMQWRHTTTHTAGSVWHVILETVFFFGATIVALFAASIAGVNLWQSALASIGIGVIATYIFGAGLQALGCGYFFFLTNFMAYGEYWQRVGSPSEGGRVRRITSFYVEFERPDPERKTAITVRVWMTTVLGSSWERDHYKELHEPSVSVDQPRGIVKDKTPATALKSSAIRTTHTIIDDDDVEYQVDDEEDDDRKRK